MNSFEIVVDGYRSAVFHLQIAVGVDVRKAWRKLIEHGAVEAFDEASGLRTSDIGFLVLNAIEGQVELVRVRIRNGEKLLGVDSKWQLCQLFCQRKYGVTPFWWTV